MTTVAIRALVIIIIVTVVGIIAVNVLIPGENTGLTIQLISIVAPTTAGLLGLINSTKNTEVLRETKAQVIETKASVVETQAEVAATKEQLAVNSEKLGALDIRVNGRLSELMEKSVEAARLLGRQQGEKDERERQGGHEC